MISRYLDSSDRELFDTRWAGPNADVLIEIKHTSNARDIRDALLALAYALAREDSRACGVCVLTRSKLSEQRLHEELARFRAVTRKDFGDRIFLAALDEHGRFAGSLPHDVPALAPHLVELAAQPGQKTQRVTRQAVKAYLVECWLRGLGPQTGSLIRKFTGASYPTVTAAMNDLRQLGALSDGVLPAALLREPGWDVWRRLAEGQLNERETTRFVDPSGQSRTPSALAHRLENMQQTHKMSDTVRIGGVLGALVHDPELSISAAPRLDLHVADGDMRFMRKLDAALIEVKDPTARAVVVVHTTSQKMPAPTELQRQSRCAPALDCMADLLEMGYQAEARDLAAAMVRTHQR